MKFNRGKKYSYYSSYSSSKRKRVRWDRIAIIGVVVALVIGLLVWFNLGRIKLMMKGYSFSQQNTVLSLSSTDLNEILSHDKMDHIENWIENSKKVSYYDEYEQYYTIHKDEEIETIINEVDDIFDNYVPKLKTLKYSNAQVWKVLQTADSDDLQYLIEKQYSYNQIEPYMQVQGFAFQQLDQYMKVYEEKKNYNYAVLVTAYPFLISSNASSSNQSYTIQDPENILTLVKKGFLFSSDYEPTDLVKPSEIPVAPDCDNATMRKEAADALTEMYKAAKQEGYSLIINSSYRSYATQQATYKEYFNKYDAKTAASLVAAPGASEHQSGLGVDLTCQSVLDDKKNGITNSKFGYKPDYKWCLANSYKYGFILRFEEDKADITGIGNEPWHFRYVGKKAAKEIFNNGWTLEEYCLYKGAIPKLKANS